MSTETNHPPVALAIIFDLGRVLVHHADTLPRTRWAADLGMSDAELCEAVWDTIVAQRPNVPARPELALLLAQRLDLEPAAAVRLEQDFHSNWQADDELMAFVRALPSSVELGLLTNAGLAVRYPIIRVKELDRIFGVIVISSEFGVEKPDPSIYLHTLDLMGVDARQTVFVDDRLENVQAAEALGMIGIHHVTASETIRRLTAELRLDDALGRP
jgi:putative hydrolase of the HAD superfamily